MLQKETDTPESGIERTIKARVIGGDIEKELDAAAQHAVAFLSAYMAYRADSENYLNAFLWAGVLMATLDNLHRLDRQG